MTVFLWQREAGGANQRDNGQIQTGQYATGRKLAPGKLTTRLSFIVLAGALIETIDRHTDRQVWMDGWMDLDRQTDRQIEMDGWMDGWMDE